MPDIMAQADHVAVRVTRMPRLTRLLLRGDPVALGAALGITVPTTACTAQHGERAVLWLGPDEWLLLAEEGAVVELWENHLGAIFDISARQVGLMVEGERASDVLAAGCPLDLAAFPVGACTRTVFGKAEIILWRRAPTRFQLETWRSFAPYVELLLTTSIRDHGA